MQTFKIMMLGASGAGKTVFLASFYNQFVIPHPITGISLRTIQHFDQINLNKLYAKVADRAADWPGGTTGFSNWSFLCSVSKENRRVKAEKDKEGKKYDVLQFDYLDYTGGEIWDPDKATAAKLDTYLAEADALLGILDGRKILAFMKKNPQEQEKAHDLIYTDLSNIVDTFLKWEKPSHLVITKWDVLQNDGITLKEIRNRLYEALPKFEPFVQERRKNNYPVRLIPVSSVGKDFVKLKDGKMQKVGDFPRPFHMEKPLACVFLDTFTVRYFERQRREDVGGVIAMILQILKPILPWLGRTLWGLPITHIEISAYDRVLDQVIQRLRSSGNLEVKNRRAAMQRLFITFYDEVRDLERTHPESILS